MISLDRPGLSQTNLGGHLRLGGVCGLARGLLPTSVSCNPCQMPTTQQMLHCCRLLPLPRDPIKAFTLMPAEGHKSLLSTTVVQKVGAASHTKLRWQSDLSASAALWSWRSHTPGKVPSPCWCALSNTCSRKRYANMQLAGPLAAHGPCNVHHYTDKHYGMPTQLELNSTAVTACREHPALIWYAKVA